MANRTADDEHGPTAANAPTMAKSTFNDVLQTLKAYIQDQWFLIGIGVVIAIASQKQVPSSQQDLKETVVTYLGVALIFLITGCTLPTKVLVENYARWKIHLFVQIQCFLMTSAVTFGIVSAAASNQNFMDPGLLVGLIFTGIVPTTISSNVVLTKQANGNQALTVVQSTLGNLIGPFVSPLLVTLYTTTGKWYTDFLPDNKEGYGEVYKRVLKELGLSLFIPLFVGQILQNLFPNATKTVMTTWKFSKVSSLCLLLIVWQTYDQAFESGAFNSVPASNMVFIVFVSIGLFLLWLAISFFTAKLWLAPPDVVAVCYCVPAKTSAMGVPLAQTIYYGLKPVEASKLQIPMVIYQGLQIAGGSLLLGAFRWWIGRAKKHELKRKTPLHAIADQS